MIKHAILKLVTEHYARGEDVLLLSQLGKALKDLMLWPIEDYGRTALHEIINEVDGVTVIRDEDAPSFILVTLAGEEARGQAAIEDHKRRIFLRTLPRALLLAFTLDLAEGQVMSVNLDGRVSYQAGPDVAAGHTLVDEEFRRPGLDVRDIRELDSAEVSDLDAKIRGWCRRYGIEPETLASKQTELARRLREARAELAPSAAAPNPGNALERLYAAQDPAQVQFLRIPMDLALTLSRLP